MFTAEQLARGAQTITASNIVVNAKEGPFGNKFVIQQAKIVKYEGVDELAAKVLCTADSIEPGRIYIVNWSLDGEMLACNTLN